MRSPGTLKRLFAIYLSVLILLLLCVALTPLVVRRGLSLPHGPTIGEEPLEAILILILLGVSFLTLNAFNRTLAAYRQAVRQAEAESTRLGDRLTEAFSYIGSVNVEIQEIRSILCGVDRYPRTRKEFRHTLEQLAAKAMAVAGTPWAVVRMLNRCSGRTVMEVAVEREKGELPPTTVGNRAILDGSRIGAMRTVVAGSQGIDLLTAAILPDVALAEAETLLISAVVKQIEMLYLLYRAGEARGSGLDTRPVAAENRAERL